MSSKASTEKNKRKSEISKSQESSDNGKADSLNLQNGGDIDEDRGTTCFACNKTVSNKDKALQCDCCNFWHHITCEQVSISTYKNLIGMKEGGVKWYCRKCNLGVQCVLTQIVMLKTKQKETDERLDYIEEKVNDLDTLENRVSAIEAKLEELSNQHAPPQRQSQTEKTYANVAALGKDDVEKIVEQRTREKLREVEDKARRQKNIIIFRLEEPEEETQEEKDMEDKVSVERLFRELNMQNTEPTNIFRLKGSAQHKDRARPLKVSFKSQASRDDFLKAFSTARKGKQQNDDRLCSKLSIRKDLTKAERIEDDKLFREMKAKQEQSKNSGDQLAKWVRRGGKVVNIGQYPQEKEEEQ